MERPKGERVAVEREVTGEIAYLDEKRRRGESPDVYPDDLSDMAVQLFEDEAAIMRQRGVRPEIMDAYEHYDNEADQLSRSCAQLAEELLKQKHTNELTFEDFVVAMPADEVRAELMNMRAGEVLAGDDEQLAFESDGSYYPVLDIKKKDATLTGVSVRVWGWQDRKYIFTNKPGEKYDYPKDCLMYPSDEKAKWYELAVGFSYTHPDAGYFNETVTLSIGQRGDLRLSGQVWVSAYAETGYEGHHGKGLREATDEDFAAFADLVAKIVGDEPEAIWQHHERQLNDYIASIDDETTRSYLREWVLNTHAGQVLSDLAYTPVDGKRLSYALKHEELAEAAQQVMIKAINKRRAERNELAADKQKTAEWFGHDIEPWQDIVNRQAES